MPHVRRGKLRCSRCQKEGWIEYLSGKYERYWNAVRLVKVLPNTGYTGLRGLFRCSRCGHEWISHSAAARRLIASTQSQGAMMRYTELCSLHRKAGLPEPCPSCYNLYAEGKIPAADIMPLRGGALDARSRYSPAKICTRCARMEGLIGTTCLSAEMFAAPVMHDWGEAIRLPAGTVWGSTRYPTGGLEYWLAYCRKRDAAIPFYLTETVQE